MPLRWRHVGCTLARLLGLALRHYTTAKRAPPFSRFAPDLQLKALADLVELDFPERAVEMRQWNVATRTAVLALCDDAVIQRPRRRETPLWTATKGPRTLRCSAVYMPTGTDLRLLEGDELLRSEFARDPLDAPTCSERWQHALRNAGWQIDAVSAGERVKPNGRIEGEPTS